MKALSKTERDSLLSELDEFNTRLADKRRQRDGIASLKAGIARDVVTGKTGAKAAVLKLDDSDRELVIEIAALETAIADSQKRWEDDAPARAAEHVAARKAAAAEIAVKLIANSREIDEHLQAAAGGFLKRGELVKALGEFGEVVGSAPQDPGHIIMGILGNAGLDKISSQFQRSGEPPHTLAEHDAESLRAVLPADDADVRRMTRFRQEKHAEYQRRNSSTIAGDIVPRRF